MARNNHHSNIPEPYKNYILALLKRQAATPHLHQHPTTPTSNNTVAIKNMNNNYYT